jgi:hypothetical protein
MSPDWKRIDRWGGGGEKKHNKNRISKDVTKEIIHHHRARQDLAKEKIKMRI